MYKKTIDAKSTLYVFGQIINNAIKYSGERGKIEFRSEYYANETVLFIKDYGIGIDEEDTGRLLD